MHQPFIQVEPIHLPGGWSGLIVTRCERPAGADDAYRSSPEARPISDVVHLRACAEQIVRDPSALDDYAVLKYSRRGEVFRARIGAAGQPFRIVGKRSRPVGVRRTLRTRLRGSRERRNFDRGLMLLRAGICTARPLFYIQRRHGRREAWLVTEFVPGLVDLDQLTLVELPRRDARRRHQVKLAATAAVVDLVVRLRRARLVHRDFKASNVLLSGFDANDPSPSAWLLDLDGLVEARWRRDARMWRPIVRLAASLTGYAAFSRTDACRFLITYLARNGLPRARWKRYYQKLSDRADDYVRRAKRRKADKLDGFADD